MDSESHVPPENHELNVGDHPRSGEEAGEQGNDSSSLFANAPQEKIISSGETRTMGSLENRKQFAALAIALITPFVATGYLAFCYMVLTRDVPVNLGPLVNTSPENLSTIKSGITTVTIIVVLIALLPLKSLIGDITSEEFFRTLRRHPDGVPLSSLNGISTPSFGKLEAFKAIWYDRTSWYYAVILVTSFLVVATSSLAPSALTVNVVPIDGPLQAFAVGSIGPSSIFNTSTGTIGIQTQSQFADNTPQSSGIAWAETLVGMNYSFSQPTSASSGSQSYIVPVPKSLSPSTLARYLSDVAVLNPSCSFQQSNITEVVTLNTSAPGGFVYVGLSGGLKVPVANSDFTPTTTQNMTLDMQSYLNPLVGSGVSNSASGSLPTDGSVIWRLGQCSSGCIPQAFLTPISYNLDGLPKVQFNVNGTIWEAVYLVCTPGTTIETREVRSIGDGQLTVTPPPPSGPGYTRQRNLDLGQMNLLLSGTFIGTDGSVQGGGAGPQFVPTSFDLGSKLQASLLFGMATVNEFNGTEASPSPVPASGSVVLTPLPAENITQAYVQIMSSAVKFYMNAGAIGTAYVPGREARNVLIFQSSKEYIAASTALFAILSVLVVGAQWRRGKMETYNFVGVAVAMESSNVQEDVRRAKMEIGDDGKVATRDDDVVKRLGNKKVVLLRTANGIGLQLY